MKAMSALRSSQSLWHEVGPKRRSAVQSRGSFQSEDGDRWREGRNAGKREGRQAEGISQVREAVDAALKINYHLVK